MNENHLESPTDVLPPPPTTPRRSRRHAITGAAVVGGLALVGASFFAGRQTTASERADLSDVVQQASARNVVLTRARDDAIDDRAEAEETTAEVAVELTLLHGKVSVLQDAIVTINDEENGSGVCATAFESANILITKYDELLVLINDWIMSAPGSEEEAQLDEAMTATFDEIAVASGMMIESSTRCDGVLDDVRTAVDAGVELVACGGDAAPVRSASPAVGSC